MVILCGDKFFHPVFGLGWPRDSVFFFHTLSQILYHVFNYLRIRLVEETLTPLDPDRRAFRLVGGVLVERTVREVLPTVREHRGNLDIVVQNLKEKLDAKQKETAAWKAKYNIKTQEEAQAANRQ
mmetsp:Transcript_4153/g.8010  ORF Transcript_4153/g.8010 Transcript_4153/m.8010 type:complete len:125 (+) Transcript_4153:722-1096(+)